MRTPTPRRVAAVMAATLLGATLAATALDREDPVAARDVAARTTGDALALEPPPTRRGPRERARADRPREPERRTDRLPTLRPARAPEGPPVGPRRLEVPAAGISLPVLPRGVDAAGGMALPASVRRTAWYRFGAGPLSGRGATVVAGHVDSRGEGAGPLARLASLRPGARIGLALPGGRRVAYRVVRVSRVPRDRLDTAALFSRTGPPRLHLVTCGGPYLGAAAGYRDNVVVLAVPAGP